MDHDEIYEDTWEYKEWLPVPKNDVLSTACSYVRYSKDIEELTWFGKTNSITSPILANKFFLSFRDDKEEPIYTFNDEYMRYFVRQSIEGGRCGSFNQYYKSIISDEVFKNISNELGIIGNLRKILDKNFEITNKDNKRRIWFTI